MFKSYHDRLDDYIKSRPGINDIDSIEYVIERVKENHMKAIWKMQHRVSDRLDYMSNNVQNVIFVTFTFNDEHLPANHTQEILTQNYIVKYMHDNKVSAYVANIDYGKKNGRFHWHAVVQTPYALSHKFWSYGTVSFKRVRNADKQLRLARYLVKLSRHAVKLLDPVVIYYPYRYRI